MNILLTKRKLQEKMYKYMKTFQEAPDVTEQLRLKAVKVNHENLNSWEHWVYLRFTVQALQNSGGYTSRSSNTSFGSCPVGSFGSSTMGAFGSNPAGTFGSSPAGTFGSQGTGSATSFSPSSSFPQNGSRSSNYRTKGGQSWQVDIFLGMYQLLH